MCGDKNLIVECNCASVAIEAKASEERGDGGEQSLFIYLSEASQGQAHDSLSVAQTAGHCNCDTW